MRINYSSWWEPRFSILLKVVLKNFRRMLLVHRFDGFFCSLNWFFKAFLLNWFATTKTWRTWSLALSVHNFLSHLHFFKIGEIMLLKYENLMPPAGHIRPILRSTIERCPLLRKLYNGENYAKLYFNEKQCKTLRKGIEWGEGVKFLVVFFQKMP